MFRSFFLLMGALWVCSTSGQATETELAVRKRPIDPQGYANIVGILAVRVEIPAEDKTPNTLSPIWKCSDGTEQTADLKLDGLPPGQEIQLFFWTHEWSEDPDTKGIRYVIQYKTDRKSHARKTGILPLPESFQALTTSLTQTCTPGELVGGTSLLKFENPDGFCEFYLGSPSDSPKPAEPEKKKARYNPITPSELYSATGILGWRVYLAPDLGESEYLTFEWWGGSNDQNDPEFSFEGFPPGQEVETYVMMDEWQKGDEKQRIRCRMQYREKGGETVQREGAIRVPETFTDIYSYLGPGDTLDGGWVLMLTNRGSGNPREQIFLEPVYRFVE